MGGVCMFVCVCLSLCLSVGRVITATITALLAFMNSVLGFVDYACACLIYYFIFASLYLEYIIPIG